MEKEDMMRRLKKTKVAEVTRNGKTICIFHVPGAMYDELLRILSERPCGWCGKIFEAKTHNQKYCCTECAAAADNAKRNEHRKNA